MKWLVAAALGASLGMAGCAVRPKYQRPAIQAPATWKTEAPWREAAPKDAISKGAWWEIFHDEELNRYEQQLLAANQSLAAARNRLDQARSLARVTSAAFFPALTADPNASRNRYSGNRPQIVAPTRAVTQTLYDIPFALNYEVDLFGRNRKNLEAANANLQGTAADLQNVQLVLSAELAADFFSLRELDAESDVVQESVKIQQQGLEVVNHRHEGGIASGLDLAQQQTLLDSTDTQLYLLQQQQGGRLRVVGHASLHTVPLDPARHDQVNYKLSATRANAVARALIGMGVPDGALSIVAEGSQAPVFYEFMPTGEAANRRVEIYLNR